MNKEINKVEMSTDDFVINEPVITFRPALIEDSLFVAKNVLAAMGWDVFNPDYDPMLSPLIFKKDDYTEGEVLTSDKNIEPLERTAKIIEKMEMVCRDEHTLYSYKNTLIASIDGVSAGSLTGYDGAKYTQMKQRTSELAKLIKGADLAPDEDETQEGEFYLDSMAVCPQARGYSLGRKLINQMVHLAREQDFKKVTLIAEKARPWLVQMYEGLGFVQESEMSAFGHIYVKMVNSK